MKIGILCYPTHGGSGVVATELGKYLAERGHHVHFLSYQQPFRLRNYHPRIFYHEVEVPAYPLFKYPPYTLALINKIAAVTREVGLDIIHAHYAVPHSLCAYLAREMVGRDKVKVITTLHGTDITLVGNDPSFKEITTFSIKESDAVTAVSHSLKEETKDYFPTDKEINVIYNFIDTRLYSPLSPEEKKERGSLIKEKGEKVLLHISNFRPVKRVTDVVRVFSLVEKDVPSRLVMVGDGMERYRAKALALELGIEDKVDFLGNQDDVLAVLRESDILLLPSEKESFGLVALEAMACGLPVIGSRAGGIPEVVSHEETGYLYAVGDTAGMAQGCINLLKDKDLYRQFSQRARQRAVESFESQKIIPFYENLYKSVL